MTREPVVAWEGLEALAGRPEPVVRREVALEAGAEAVWAALTSEGGLAGWMGAGSRVDVRPGGQAWFADPEGGVARRARVLAVEDGRRLVWEWWSEDDPANRSVVELTVTADAPGASRLAVVERPPAAVDVQARAGAPAVGAGRTAGAAALRGAAWTWRLAMLQLAVVAGALVG